MAYVVVHRDRIGGLPLRLKTRARHLEYLIAHRDKFIFGGPFLDDEGRPIGGLMVLDLPDLAAVQAFLESEPYFKARLHESITIHPWRQVLPEPFSKFLEQELLAQLHNDTANESAAP